MSVLLFKGKDYSGANILPFAKSNNDKDPFLQKCSTTQSGIYFNRVRTA